ncbi:hypothetical protein A8709_01940 [Paenibacillus pectinilyticus]|uniref:Uncharacterized protein n=1 Tax=Paenibacillus pectinilyticus TaxID=512399 RepID=A0A1C1A6P2_9BACL|nr:hypothetical protein [Paenibacillus pectinilyticus]OCT16224.1 hypothetical protein A8709_01940 [Paenibacillus pectinilyticus]
MKYGLSKLLVAFMLSLSLTGLGVSQAHAAQHEEQPPMRVVPMLAELKQISPNQLQVTYDQPVDLTKGMTPTNYWIQDMMNVTPKGIATLGKNDTVNATNSLTMATVTIQPVSGANQSFILTLKHKIPKGKAYKMIICYVTKPGDPPFSGDNGSAAFVGN